MKMKTIVGISLAIFLVTAILIILSGSFLDNSKTSSISTASKNLTIKSTQQNSTQTLPQKDVTQEQPTTSTTKGYTLEDVSKHNSPSNCWIIVNNKVYGVTSYIKSHLGGQSAITRYCGNDASSAFESQHSQSRSANSELSSLLIGDLV